MVDQLPQPSASSEASPSQPVAIVTGSSRGIGRAIALCLAERGWQVVINYHSRRDAAEEAASLTEARGGGALLVQADLGSLSDLERLVDATLARYGRIDLLVNNAGIGPRQRLDVLQTTEESYDHVMSVNLKGPFFLTQRVANDMIRLIQAGVVKKPKIVNISSISAYTSSTNRAEYCISKAGLSMLTTVFADRLAEYGINVYEIRPGIIATDLTAGVKEKYDHLIFEQDLQPLHRWGQPEDVGRAVAAIAEDLLPFSTGEVINIDGGFHLKRL
jgi:NAD(P)-dependent dehydrogenase (short-subunit alcohol dehydrogenase family)